MKRILITGANSYVGTNVERELYKYPDKYFVDTLDMQDPNWRNHDFTKYEVVFHVAGIAHVKYKASYKDIYFQVNRDLAIEVGLISKKSGVKLFIFMSSMIVYNSKETQIKKNTIPNPDNNYGKSKLEAEKGLLKLETDYFKVTILRPPMIYGPQSKGNFRKLINLARRTIVFPKYINTRSVLYIDNLSNVVKYVIDFNISGLLFPQNKEYFCTYNLVKFVSKFVNKRIIFTKLFNPIIRILISKSILINKLFSDSYYDMDLSNATNDYCVVDFDNSVINTMKGST